MLEAIIKTPYFGICLAIITYWAGAKLQKLCKGNPIVNPLLISIILCVAILKLSNISYENFMVGGSYVSFFIAPATVAMVVNLYKNIDLLKKNLLPVLLGVIVGVITAIVSTYLLCKIFRFDQQMTYTMLPHSLTTAIGVSLAGEYGGLSDITTVVIVLTGVTGAVIAPIVMKFARVKDPVAKGIGIGTSSHAVGTSKALEMGEVEGAMSGLSIALAGFITVLIMPLLVAILP